MKKISDLYDSKLDLDIYGIKNNSSLIEKGDLFVCTKGVTSDRHDFIDEAIEKGANFLVVEREGNYKVPYIKVENTNKELGRISKLFYDDPLKDIKLIAITGTDGKTTTATLIKDMLGKENCGYIGTNGVFCKEDKIGINNTTPEVNETYKYLDMFRKNNLKYATIEASSEALLYDRMNTLDLDVVIFTNITEDHLNVHKDIESYVSAKEKIFKLLKKDSIVILNRDDEYYERLSKKTDCKILTYGNSISSDLVIIDICEYATGTIFTFSYEEKLYKVMSPLVGRFNVYNLCASILTLTSLGYPIDYAIERIRLIEEVPGRCEFLEFGQDYKIVLDYAHTTNGLKNILTYLNKIKDKRIITVMGSAGGREKEKRGKMGEVVLNLSDDVIFTMDDPRYENVDDIIDDLIKDSDKTNYIRELDRKKAIERALSMAQSGDIVLIAGKGRDNYMAIDDKKLKYSDFEVIEEFLS